MIKGKSDKYALTRAVSLTYVSYQLFFCKRPFN